MAFIPTGNADKRPKKKYVNDNMRFYNSSAWRRLSKKLLRIRPFCPCGDEAKQVDHIVPINQGGAMLDTSNLQTLCVSCHAKKTANETFGRDTN